MPSMFDSSIFNVKYKETPEKEFYISMEPDKHYGGYNFVNCIYDKNDHSWDNEILINFRYNFHKIKMFGDEVRYVTDRSNTENWLRLDAGQSREELESNLFKLISLDENSDLIKTSINAILNQFFNHLDLEIEYYKEEEQYRKCLCCNEWKIFIDDGYTLEYKNQEVIIDPDDVICGRCVKILAGLEDYYNSFYLEFYKDPIALDFIRNVVSDKEMYAELLKILETEELIPEPFIQKVLEAKDRA